MYIGKNSERLGTFDIIEGTQFGVSIRETVPSAIRVSIMGGSNLETYNLAFPAAFASIQTVTNYIISITDVLSKIQTFDPTIISGSSVLGSFTPAIGDGTAITAPYEIEPCYLAGSHLG